MARSNPDERINDYKESLRCWIENKAVQNIIFIENSGFDLSVFREIANQAIPKKNIEFISVQKNDFPRRFGKGYGEILTLIELLNRSNQIRETKRFIKVTGRYYIKNIEKIINGFSVGTSIYCNLGQKMTYSDSRVFGGDLTFLENYLCKHGLIVDDSKGIFIEHALARSFLRGVSDGMSWKFLGTRPVIVGIYGTLNTRYKDNYVVRLRNNIGDYLKQFLMNI
jgi:hypothetical protein